MRRRALDAFYLSYLAPSHALGHSSTVPGAHELAFLQGLYAALQPASTGLQPKRQHKS